MYTGIFRTCREKHNLIKILTFNKINNIILAFYDELLKHPFGCFCFGEIFITRAKHYVIPSEAWESPGTDTLLNKAVPFREIATASPLAMPRNDIMTSFEASSKGAFVLGKSYLI